MLRDMISKLCRIDWFVKTNERQAFALGCRNIKCSVHNLPLSASICALKCVLAHTYALRVFVVLDIDRRKIRFRFNRRD